MITEERLAELRSSRRGNRIAAFGALCVIAAFTVAIWQLFRVEQQVEQHKEELREARTELEALKKERDKLIQSNSELRKQKLLLKRSNQELDEAVRLQQNRDYAQSLAKLQIIIQNDPENEVALYSAAHAAYQLKNYQQAVEFASSSIKIDRNYFEPHVPLICSLDKAGKKAQALQELKSLVNGSLDAYASLISRERYFEEIWAVKDYRDALIRHQQKLISIQKALKEFGLYNCPQCKLDGIVGANTRQGVQSFLASRGLTNSLTVDEIMSAMSQPEGTPPNAN